MARARKALPAKVDVAHLISAGVLASVCPRALIEEVLADTGKASQRERLLPAPAVVYYVMALALWREAPLEEVLRVVCEGLQWLGGGQAGAVQASKSAISQARTRLGPEVMRRLAERVLRPLAAPGAPGAWYRGFRVMALDGSCMFDEFKTHLRANSTVLRSKTPQLLEQELWGLLLAHFAIRQLMVQAAWPRGLDPDRLSFTHAVRVIKRKMPQAAAIPP